MYYFIICLLVLFAFPGCTRKVDMVDIKYEAEKTRDVTTLVEQYTAKFHKKYNMHLRNACLDTDDFGVTTLLLEYTTQRIMDICEARRLTVDVMEEFLSNGKNHELLQLYLSEPLTAADIELHIHFETFFGKYVDPLYVERVLVSEGMVYFYAFTAFLHASQTWDYRSEDYGISKNIVDAQNEIAASETLQSVQKPIDKTIFKQAVEVVPGKLPPPPKDTRKLENEIRKEEQLKQQTPTAPAKPQYKNPW